MSGRRQPPFGDASAGLDPGVGRDQIGQGGLANYIKTLASHAAEPPGASRVGVVLRPVRGNVTDLGTPWGE
jgi:hypothetical protein